jgi:MFS family permease
MKKHKMLSDLPRTAKYTILSQLPWGLFCKIVLFYAPLYMKAVGLNEIQIGSISTIGLFFAFIWQLLASPIINKFGRKRTLFVFDLICWTAAMFIWAVAQNYWYFVAAAAINAAVKVSGVAYFCLLTEDTKPEKRAKALGTVNVVNNAPGLLMPIAGLAIAKFGIVPAMRFWYFLGGIVLTCGFVFRNAMITETSAGIELMKKHSNLKLASSIHKGFGQVKKYYNNKEFRSILWIYILTNIVFATNFIQVIYLKDRLGFDEKELALTQVISALTYLLYLGIMPRIKSGKDKKILTVSLYAGVAGAILFIAVPKGSILFMLAAMVVITVGNFVSVTYRDAVFMNSVGKLEKADIYSTVQIISAIVCTPVGWLVGLGYTYNPIVPFIGVASLLLIAAVSATNVMLSGKTTNKACVGEH